MNILIVSQYYWPESFRINDVAKTLFEKGQMVEVLTGKPNYPRGVIYNGYKSLGCVTETHNEVPIHRIPMLARGQGSLRLVLNYLSFVISGILFSPWMLRRKKFDVIFVYGNSPILQTIPAIFLGWIKRTQVVLWVQDLWPESIHATGYIKNKLVLKLIDYIVRFIYRHVDLLLVQSEAFIDLVEPLASNTPVKYYPNSVDESFSERVVVSNPKVTGLTNGFSVMFAGNIGSAQAVEVIIEAAALLKEYSDIHFVVLGDGSRRDWMLEEVNNRGLSNLHLPGRFPIESMPSFMQQASALLVTLADHKIFSGTVPNKIQAYMAAGRPILACLNGEGADLVIASKSGLAVPAENAKALAEAVLELHGMSMEDREELGQNGFSYYKEHFDHDKLVTELIGHFELLSQNVKELN
jgi:glycosyltransferase involved in cell wall biosynthesis